MARYTLQAFKGDALQSPLNQGATSGTLTSGAFGSPTGPQLLVIDPETPAKREIISATISGTALTSITRGLDGTADVDHAANAPVIMAFVPSHYAQVATAAEDGWIPVAEVHTRVTDNQTTVPGDLTAKYRKGTKVKGTNTTVKYRVVDSSSHAGGTTTINYVPTTDYVWAAGTISNVSVSYIENPEGWPNGGWFNATPTLGNLSGGTVNIFRWRYEPGIVDVEFFYTLGGAGVAGSVSITLPVTSASYNVANAVTIGDAHFQDTGVTSAEAGFVKWSSATTASLFATTISGSRIHITALSSTFPFTWGNGDTISAKFSYKPA